MECPATGSACPNPLATTQRLCLEMTGMEMCDRFVTMCDAAGDDLSHFCTNNLGTYDPPMRMYFHTGVRDMILFRGWVPKSTGALVGSIVAVLLAGILAGALRAYRACTEAFHRARQNTVRLIVPPAAHAPPAAAHAPAPLLRALPQGFSGAQVTSLRRRQGSRPCRLVSVTTGRAERALPSRRRLLPMQQLRAVYFDSVR